MIDPTQHTASPQRERLFRTTITLLYTIAAFWALFALHWLFRGSDYRYFYAVSGVGYAVVLALLARYLNRKLVWAWWVTVIFLGANILLTIADQVGWFDIAYLIPSIAVFVLVFMIKSALGSSRER